MSPSVKWIPDGYHAVIPQIRVKGADKQIDFLKKAFDAQETERLTMPDGSIAHAEVRLGNSVIMLSDAVDDDYKPTYSEFHLYVEDCDSAYEHALQEGATSVMQPANQFYGDRSAEVKDPFGNRWWIDTHLEDLSKEELTKRMDEYIKKSGQG